MYFEEKLKAEIVSEALEKSGEAFSQKVVGQEVGTERGACIRVACEAFGISESCHRYERKLYAQYDKVVNWLIRLTDNHCNWGFGLCYVCT
jgi:putative transposase